MTGLPNMNLRYMLVQSKSIRYGHRLRVRRDEGNRTYQAMRDPRLQLTDEIVPVVKPVRTFTHDIAMHVFFADRGGLATTAIGH